MEIQKYKKTSTIITSILLGIAFLIEVPVIQRLILSVIMESSISFMEFFGFAFCATILSSILVIIRRYLNLGALLKAFGVMLVFLFVDTLVPMLFSSVETLERVILISYQLLRPWLVTAILLLLFRWIAKCRIVKDKKIFTIIAVAYVLYVIFNIIEYFRLHNMINRLTVNSFFGYLELFDSGNAVNSFMLVLCFYVQIFLVFLLLIKSLALYGKEPIKRKNVDIVEGGEVNSPTNTEGVNWKCMGCGELVPVEKDRCTCGYKK